MLKEKFLVKVKNENLHAFYLNHMVGVEDGQYELFPNEERTTELIKIETQAIKSGDAIPTLQSLIMRFAENELEMSPIRLFFPTEQVVYLNTLNNMTNLAYNWRRMNKVLDSESDLPEYQNQYDNLATITELAKKIYLKDGIDLTLLNSYFAGGES